MWRPPYRISTIPIGFARNNTTISFQCERTVTMGTQNTNRIARARKSLLLHPGAVYWHRRGHLVCILFKNVQYSVFIIYWNNTGISLFIPQRGDERRFCPTAKRPDYRFVNYYYYYCIVLLNNNTRLGVAQIFYYNILWPLTAVLVSYVPGKKIFINIAFIKE